MNATSTSNSAPSTKMIPPLPRAERCGQIVDAQYRLDHRLVSGTIHEIYRAFDLIRQSPCTLKLICQPSSALGAHPLPLRQLLLREAEILTRLSHWGIPSVREVREEQNGQPYLVLEAMDGQDLSSRLAARNPPSLPEIAKVMRAAGLALQHAHDCGVVHGDLKPRSLFIETKGELAAEHPLQSGKGLKVLDFGLAKVPHGGTDHQNPRYAAGRVIGTPAYLAPEALRQSDDELDARSDQWSLAVIAYRLLSGRLPFQHADPCYLGAMIRELEPEPLHLLRPDLPEHVLFAISIALSKQKAKRFGSIMDFVSALTATRASRQRSSARAGEERPDSGPKTLKAVRMDLIELCRQEACSGIVAEPVAEDSTTRRYPSAPDSFAKKLLSPDALAAPSDEAGTSSRRRTRLTAVLAMGLLAGLAGLLLQQTCERRPRPSAAQSAQAEATTSSRRPRAEGAAPTTSLAAESTVNRQAGRPVSPSSREATSALLPSLKANSRAANGDGKRRRIEKDSAVVVESSKHLPSLPQQKMQMTPDTAQSGVLPSPVSSTNVANPNPPTAPQPSNRIEMMD